MFIILLFFSYFTLSLQVSLRGSGNVQSFLSSNSDKTSRSDIFLHIIPLINFDSAGYTVLPEDLFKGKTDNKISIQLIFENIFDTLSETNTKTLTLTEFSYFQKYYLSCTEEKQEKIKGLIKNGNLEFCLGGYVKIAEQLVNYEQIISQIVFVSRFLLTEFQYLPKTSCNLGTHGHSFLYNEILSESGYDGVFIDSITLKESKKRKVEKNMEFFTEYQGKFSDKTIFTHINYLNNNDTVFGDGCYQVLWDGIEGDIIKEKMLNYIDWIYQQTNFFQSNQIFHQIGGDYKFNDSTTDYIILDFIIKFLNKNYETFKIKAGYSTPYIYLNELSKEKQQSTQISFERQNALETKEFFYHEIEKRRSIGLFSNRQWMKGFIKHAWEIYESYKIFFSINFLQMFSNMEIEKRNNFLKIYEKNLNALEKKVLLGFDDKALNGLVHEFVARKLKADIKDIFLENFEVLY